MEIVNGKECLSQVRELITEYTNSLGRDLSFQNLEDELRDPLQKYTPPHGEMIVVMVNKKALGMAAYHRHSDIRCEMKRLYVRPEARGLHLGDTLVQEIIRLARKAGYKEMVLDTIKPLTAAINLYKKYGFEECEPYYNNPMKDVIYMVKSL